MANLPTFSITTFQGASRFAQFVASALRSLTFADNFYHEIWEGTIAAGAEVTIPHQIGRIPFGYLVVRATAGPIVDGSDVFTKTTISLKNDHATDSSVAKIIILG